MNDQEIKRIQDEYKRRAYEIPEDFYSLEHPTNLFIYTQRFQKFIRTLKSHGLFPLKAKKALEIGCGKGDWLIDFMRLGAEPENVRGIELDETRLAHAKKRMPAADLRSGNAAELPWPDQSMDIVLQSTVFTSILDNGLKKKIAGEMLRVLKKDGVIIWYDFFWDNPNNPNVKGVKASEISQLFPGCLINLKPITLAPPLTRSLIGFSWGICGLLEKLKFLNTHYLGVIRKS